MIAYKGFEPGLVCRGYQFVMGSNTTAAAQTAQCGFHCAADPLDCLTYYPNMEKSEYYIVDARGDIDEDDHDSKIACTEMVIVKQLTKEEFFLHALAYMVDHPKMEPNDCVMQDKATSNRGFAVVRGLDPIAKGAIGDILAFAKEDETGKITEIAMTTVDGNRILANTWYGVDLQARAEALL